MKCAEVQERLSGDPDDTTLVDHHLRGCLQCQQVLDDLRAMRQVAPSMAVPQLPDGFELELRRQLVQQARGMAPAKAPVRWRRLGLAVALAASLLLTVGAGLWLLSQRAGRGPREPAAAVALDYQRLQLTVHASEAHGDALFDVELPPGVRLAAGLAQTLGTGPVVRWRSDILPGVNQIELPLALERGHGRRPVQARIIAAGRVYRAQIPLAAQAVRGGERPAVRLALVLDPGRTP